MTANEFKARHAKTIASLWGGISSRYNLSEDAFAERLHSAALRTGESESKDQGLSFLQSVRGEELCLVLACENGNEDAWQDFDRNYRSGMQAAARALTKD